MTSRKYYVKNEMLIILVMKSQDFSLSDRKIKNACFIIYTRKKKETVYKLNEKNVKYVKQEEK